MFKEFFNKYKADPPATFRDAKPTETEEIEKFVVENYPTLHSIFKEIGGVSFNNGAFRVHTFGASATWSNLLREYIPDFQYNFYCFGYDWMGCMYGYSIDDEPTVFIFDPADMDTREAPATVDDFFNVDLVKYRKQTLLIEKFEAVKDKLNIQAVEVDECLGYKESLFLGGEDVDTNFDLWNLEVYWEIQNKIFKKIKNLPDGAEIGDINLDE